MRNKSKEPEKAPIQSIKHSSLKKWVIISIIVLVLLIGGAASVFIFILPNRSAPVSSSKEPYYSKQDNIEIYNTVSEKLSESGSAAAQSYLDQKLNEAKDSESRALIFVNKAALASSINGDNDCNKALEYALKAEDANSTYRSALILAQCYEDTGDVNNAIKFYKLYLERFDIYRKANVIEPSEDDYDYYSARLQELESE